MRTSESDNLPRLFSDNQYDLYVDHCDGKSRDHEYQDEKQGFVQAVDRVHFSPCFCVHPELADTINGEGESSYQG